MKTFLNSKSVVLVNGGFLSNKEGNLPVDNAEFVEAQQSAEYVITFAKMAKGKDFVGTKAASLEDFKTEVFDALYSDKAVEYVKAGKAPVSKITDTLKSEAMAFLDFKKDEGATEQINEFLQKFNILRDFEAHGLFFDQGIVKLNKIYTVAEITVAVKAVIALID